MEMVALQRMNSQDPTSGWRYSLQKFSPFLFTILFKCPKLNVSLPLTCTLSTDLLVLVGYCLNICMMIQNCSFDVMMLLCVDLSFPLTEFLLNYMDKKMPF